MFAEYYPRKRRVTSELILWRLVIEICSYKKRLKYIFLDHHVIVDWQWMMLHLFVVEQH
jgi:hypothetical protein